DDISQSQQTEARHGQPEGVNSDIDHDATEKGKRDSDATIALAKYLMDGRGERTKEMVGLQQQIQTNQEQTQFVQRKLREMTAGSSKTEQDAVIVVDKANPGPGKVRLNYLVDSAAWRPQ